MTPLRTHCRWMIRRDMSETLAIEAGSPEPRWTEEDFLARLRQRNTIGMVAEYGDRIVGQMVYSLQPDRLDLLNFGVHPAYRRRGVGEQMVCKLIGKLSSHRRTHIDVAVRESAVDMQLFLRACDFWCHRVSQGMFDTEDGYLFRYTLEGLEVADAEDFAEARP
jgi:[ribosomal protein S18]-alanine N-acetyltransferase